MVGEITSRGEDELTVNRWLPVREENGIVYAVTDSLPGLIEYDFNENEIPYQQLGNECVLYNFNKKIGETIYPQNKELRVESYGTYQLMDGTVCRVLNQEGLCVNDTCWSRDDAEAYVPSYRADPRQEEVFSYIRCLQTATGIHNLQSQNPVSTPYSDIYDIHGRKLSDKPARGIYIDGGKKKVK